PTHYAQSRASGEHGAACGRLAISRNRRRWQRCGNFGNEYRSRLSSAGWELALPHRPPGWARLMCECAEVDRARNMTFSEKQKMLAGELYRSADPELQTIGKSKLSLQTVEINNTARNYTVRWTKRKKRVKADGF